MKTLSEIKEALKSAGIGVDGIVSTWKVPDTIADMKFEVLERKIVEYDECVETHFIAFSLDGAICGLYYQESSWDGYDYFDNSLDRIFETEARLVTTYEPEGDVK